MTKKKAGKAPANESSDKAPRKQREEPFSLFPLSPEEAITAFMNADPAKVEERLRQKGVKKPKK